MTNLPITTGAPQAAAVSKQAPNAAENGDMQNSQAFGDVLARQIKDPNVKDAKADDKSAVDALSQLGTDINANKKDAANIKKDTPDIKKTDPVATDTATTLPTDMLAALLPQVMNTPAASGTSPAPNSDRDSSAISANTTRDKRGIVPPKANPPAGIQTDTAAKTAAGTNIGAQIDKPSFATALTESANRNPGGMEPGAVALATAPQSNAAARAALQNTAASLAASSIQPVQVTVNTPVTQDKWADEFSQKITWLASSNKDQTAELHLNPPQLGPLDVVIKVSGDQATALFTSPHAAVRDAIEQAMPKLRDMLADNGIMLGNATVSDQAPRDQGQSGAQRASAPAINDIRDTVSVSNSAPRVSPITRHNGIVDTFA